MIRTTLERMASQTELEILSGSSSTSISGIADDSRQVHPGDVFFCIPGAKVDGARFALDAVGRGAAAVVTQTRELSGLPVPILLAHDCRLALSRAIRLLHRETIDRLEYVGVTGTNGKTTTTHLIASVLRAAGRRVAIVGTLGTLRENGSRVPSKNTTPGSLDLLRTIETVTDERFDTLVMEVSSQAIVQHRVDFLPFRNAVWTNLSPEHFELHGDLETYRRIKVSYIVSCEREAIEESRPHASVLNLRDGSCPEFLASRRGRVFGFLLGSGPATGFDGELVRGEDPLSGLDSGTMVVSHRDDRFPVRINLGGHFNLENALVAAAIGLDWGVGSEAIVRGLADVATVPGRYQRVPSEKRRVLIDYAHTSEGLENLLSNCRRQLGNDERLIVVFGCGGDRDNTKRPRMGATASRLADRCIITNDNPRTEDPVRIVSHILEGISSENRSKCVVEHDRRRAIEIAIQDARPADLIVVAGKGHEDYQLVGDRVLHFDDFEVVQETLQAL